MIPRRCFIIALLVLPAALFALSPFARAGNLLVDTPSTSGPAATPATAPTATAPASTQPVRIGRDTPEGAMNVYHQALDQGDLATLADSYNQPPMPPADIARVLIIEHRLHQALVAHFDPADVENINRNMRERSFDPPAHHYVADDFEHPPHEPDVVYGKRNGDVQTSAMQRGPDGIWRIGRIFKRRPIPPERAAGVAALRARQHDLQAQQQTERAALLARYEQVTADINAGKLETAAEVLHALYPDGTPLEKLQAAQAQSKAQEIADDAEQQRQLLAQKFDPGTVQGAMGAFLQARAKRDPAGLAAFFYAKGDTDNRLAKANAQRILAELDLEAAAKKVFADQGGELLSGGLSKMTDLPMWFDNPVIKGDTAAAQSEGSSQMIFRKVDGVWKEDLSLPASPQTRAQAMEDDTAKAKLFIAGLLAGKYKNAQSASTALRDLHLYPGDNGGIVDKP